MSQYDSGMSTLQRLSATTTLTAQQATVIKQTYLLFGLSVVSAIAGGAIGATSETLARFFSGWIGWLVAIVALNAIPYIAMSVRHNATLGVLALFFNGFLAGIVLSPLLFFASLVAPALIVVALAITGIVFLAITAYIFFSGRTFSAPRGLMIGMFVSMGLFGLGIGGMLFLQNMIWAEFFGRLHLGRIRLPLRTGQLRRFHQ